jgi:HlyD family secretion protein
MKPRTVIIIAALIAVIVIVIFVLLSSREKIYYQFTKVTTGDIQNTIESTGNLQYAVTNNVNALVAGTIVKIYADFNQKVYKGEMLAKIDDTLLKATADQMRASWLNSEASLKQAQYNYDETKALFDQQFTSQSNMDAASYSLEAAKAGAAAAKAALDTALVNLSNAYIYSPMTGVVVQRNIDVGNAVGSLSYAETPLFVIAADLTKMQVLADVAESDIGQVRRGQKATFTVQAYMDRTFTGVVHDIYVMPTMIQNVVNYYVVINVDNSRGLLYPGMTATIDITTDAKTNVMEVPSSVLKFRPTPEMLKLIFTNAQAGQRGRFRGGMTNRQGYQSQGSNNIGQQNNLPVLWTYDESSGRITPVRVQLGLSDGQMTEIISDRIHPGMTVISGISNQGLTAATASQPSLPFQGAFPGGGMGRGMGR